GWSGSWKAQFRRDTQGVLGLQGGMGHTRLKLLAGEEVRTPRILMLFWEGARLKAHNQFRQLVLAHYTPHREGKPVQMPLSANSWSLHNSGSETSEENQIELIRRYKASKIPLECYWLDAGWYEGVDGVERWGECVGNWFPKKRTFPNGFRALADEVAKAGLGFVLWFEPERAKPGTQLYEEFPQWMIMPDEDIVRTRREKQQWEQPWTDKVEALPDFGNPQLREWFTDHVSSMIEQYGVTVFRQDFNFDPAAYWRLADGEDREGITEIRFIEGLYEFWEELVRRHPGLLIDNCASGGRRIDLETITRSVALHRTDNAGEPEAAQSHTMGINLYYPCSGTGIFADLETVDRYYLRSCLAAAMQLCWDVYADDFDAVAACSFSDEFKLLRPLFYGDFYPLTVDNCSRNSDVWCAYQLYREDLNRGAVVAFRRENSPYPGAQLKLHGLDAAATYECNDIDTDVKTAVTGRELMEEGLEIAMPQAPDSRILVFSPVAGD
ncbi:MAG: alpha-galactosidase, partial [Lentisphaeria bacterium]|nr:alpha-galactosidase [Lentisphaeria bacterium]